MAYVKVNGISYELDNNLVDFINLHSVLSQMLYADAIIRGGSVGFSIRNTTSEYLRIEMGTEIEPRITGEVYENAGNPTFGYSQVDGMEILQFCLAPTSDVEIPEDTPPGLFSCAGAQNTAELSVDSLIGYTQNATDIQLSINGLIYSMPVIGNSVPNIGYWLAGLMADLEVNSEVPNRFYLKNNSDSNMRLGVRCLPPLQNRFGYGFENNDTIGDDSGWSTVCLSAKEVPPEVGIFRGITVEALYVEQMSDVQLLPAAYQSTPTGQSHTCNNANSEIYGNGVFIGNVLMNNDNGSTSTTNAFVEMSTSSSPIAIYGDYKNTPSALTGGQWFGSDRCRYSKIVITTEQAEQIAAANTANPNVIDFVMQMLSVSPHSDITWLRISKTDADGNNVSMVNQNASNGQHFYIDVVQGIVVSAPAVSDNYVDFLNFAGHFSLVADGVIYDGTNKNFETDIAALVSDKLVIDWDGSRIRITNISSNPIEIRVYPVSNGGISSATGNSTIVNNGPSDYTVTLAAAL